MVKEIETVELSELGMNEEALEEILKNSVTAKARTKNEQVRGAVLSVINHKNGKRVKLGEGVVGKLDIKEGDFVTVNAVNQKVIIKKSSAAENGLKVSGKNLIYNKSIVEMITEEFKFDFSNRSTHHLFNAKSSVIKDEIVVFIGL